MKIKSLQTQTNVDNKRQANNKNGENFYNKLSHEFSLTVLVVVVFPFSPTTTTKQRQQQQHGQIILLSLV